MPQQATVSSVGANHPVRALESLAKQIALPAEYSPQRFPSFPALERTALMGFTQPATMDVPVGQDTKVMLARQAAYPLWGQLSATGESYSVTWGCPSPQTSQAFGSRDLVVLDQVTAARVGNSTATTTLPGVSGTTTAFTWPIVGEDYMSSPNPFVYLPEGFAAHVIVNFSTAAPAGGTATITIEEWQTPGQCSATAVTATLSTGNLGCAAVIAASSVTPRWLRPINIDFAAGAAWAGGSIPTVSVTIVVYAGAGVYTASTTNYGTVTVTPAAVRSMLPVVYPAEFVNSQLPWMSTRLTAAAALFTNVTQVLNKGGTVLAGRVNPATFNPWKVSKSVINGLHPAEKAFMPLETGLYTYCPPSTDMSEFWDYSLNTTAGAAATPVYRLDNAAMVNVAFFTPGSVAEALAINCSWHLEFRTSSALFQVGMSAVTLESLHQAQLALARVGFFFENPNHVMILQKVIQAVQTFGGPLLAAARGVINYVNGKKPKRTPKRSKRVVVVKPLTIVPRPGPTRVPPTSGQRSGITSAPKKMASGLDLARAKYGHLMAAKR